MLDIDESQLVDLIRKIVRQEIKNNSINIEYSYFGVVESTSEGRFNVKNPSDGSVYTNLLNQSGTSLSVGDVVKISAKGNKMGNAIIVSKNGATINT